MLIATCHFASHRRVSSAASVAVITQCTYDATVGTSQSTNELFATAKTLPFMLLLGLDNPNTSLLATKEIPCVVATRITQSTNCWLPLRLHTLLVAMEAPLHVSLLLRFHSQHAMLYWDSASDAATTSGQPPLATTLQHLFTSYICMVIQATSI